MPSLLPGQGSSWVGCADGQGALFRADGSAEVHANVVTALIKRDALATHRQKGSHQRESGGTGGIL